MNYELVFTDGVAELTCLREFTAEDGVAALTEVAEASWFPELRCLVILDRGSAFSPTRDRIKTLVALMERILEADGVRIAIVVAKVVHYGIGRVLETRADYGGEHVRVFLKEEAARQWLGIATPNVTG